MNVGIYRLLNFSAEECCFRALYAQRHSKSLAIKVQLNFNLKVLTLNNNEMH